MSQFHSLKRKPIGVRVRVRVRFRVGFRVRFMVSIRYFFPA